MWIQDTTTHDRSPLRVWLGVTSDWSITEDQLRRRGIALAAFAIAMSEVRPVIITCWVNRGEYASDNVYGYRRRSPAPAPASLKGALISWDIKSSPLVLAQLLASTADPLITRHVGLPACTLLNPELTTQAHRSTHTSTPRTTQPCVQPWGVPPLTCTCL
jgi:hypothetical protein